MRTNIVINDDLMDEAITLSSFTTKEDVVDEALKLLVRLKKQGKIQSLKGKLKWEGDLEKMRLDE